METKYKADTGAGVARANLRERTAGGLAAHETIKRLRRNILRLAFSFQGRHSELDARLKALGAMIRGDRDDAELHTLIDDVVEMIVSQDLAQNPALLAGHSLATLFAQIDIEDSAAAGLQALQKQLDEPQDRAGFDRLMQESAALVSSLINADRQPEADDDPRPSAPDPACEVLDLFLDKLQVAALDDHVSGLRQRIARQRDHAAVLRCAEAAAAELSEILAEQSRRADDDELISSTRVQLLSLVERISFPGDLLDDAGRIRRLLESADSPAALAACIPATAKLIVEMKSQLQSEINELAEFLKAVTKRLQEVENSIQHSLSSHDKTIENADNFSQSMQQRIYGIRDEIGEQDELDGLKTVINTHLDIIDESLSEFSEEERHRHSEARELAGDMVTKLRDLENETQRLRDDLEEQHARVLIDPLTTILNRAGYDQHVGKSFARWHRYGGSLSLAVFDVDLFKQINDTHGHAAGDRVLIAIAGQLANQIRESDILCRYGGEEFVLILPETDIGESLNVADKLRRYIGDDCRFHAGDQSVPVTMSCGVAEFGPGDTPDKVFERADQAMYLAKRRGRNCCCGEQELETAHCQPAGQAPF